MTRAVFFLIVSVVCFLLAGLDAAKIGVDLLTTLAWTEFGVAAFVAAKIP